MYRIFFSLLLFVIGIIVILIIVDRDGNKSEDFDWEPKGSNLFDEKIKEIFPNGEEIKVENLRCECGDGYGRINK